MSLKSFHIVFITTTFCLMVFLLHWTSARAASGAPQPGLRLCAQVGLAAALVYLAWFIRKYKGLT